MNNRVWILGTAIASIAVIALGVVVGILPKFTEAGLNTVSLASTQAQNAAYQAELEALKKQYENIDDVRAQLDELQKSLPAGGDYAAFVDELAQLSAATGVQVLETSQTAPLVYGAAAADGADTGNSAAPISGGTLLAIPYTVKVDTTDPLGVYKFMDALRVGDRLLLITAFNFERTEDNNILVYTVNISLYLYTLVDPNSVPADTSNDVPTDPVPTGPAPSPTPTSTESAVPSGSPTPTSSATPTP